SDVLLENGEKFADDALTAERREQLAVDINGSFRLLERSRERYADIGVLRLTRPVDDATHDGDAHLFHAWVPLAPQRHLLTNVGLDIFGHMLEEGGRRSSAARTRRDLGREAAQT